MVNNVVGDLDSPGTVLWEDPAVFTNLQVMCEGYINSANPPDRKSVYQSAYAAICWRTGHYDMARRILDELGDKVDGQIFMRDFKVPVAVARAEIYALAGPFAHDLNAARTLVASNLHMRAIDGYQDVVKLANGDTNVVAYATQKIEALRLTMQTTQGEWVPLAIPKDMTGWSVRAGVWKVDDDGAVVGESTPDGLLLVCNQLFDQNLEIKGELEFIQARTNSSSMPASAWGPLTKDPAISIPVCSIRPNEKPRWEQVVAFAVLVGLLSRRAWMSRTPT